MAKNMRCPKCGCQDDKVIDSRASREGSTIRRRRECLGCEHRFTTYEEIERLKSGDISFAEIEKAKRQIEASFVLSSEEPLQQAMLIGQYETIAFRESVPADSRGYQYLDTLLERIAAVTVDDVARVAQKYFSQDNRTVGYLISESSTEAGEHGRAA